MQLMVLTRRRTEAFDDADFTPERLDAETEAVKRLFAAGIVRQIWHRRDVGGACLMFEADSVDAVRASLATLPLFQAGMQEAVCIVPLQPYRGFAPRVSIVDPGVAT